MENPDLSREISLYFHIPFCGKKCDYCGFYSLPTGGLTRAERELHLGRYVDALVEETARRLEVLKAGKGREIRVPSIYIGGGTPSLLGAGGITRLMKGLADIPGIFPAEEITVEANPETADRPFLEACALGGINRLSLGIQSFDREARRRAGRSGGFPDRGLSLGAEIFGAGLSLDLMSGLPGQDREVLLRDIGRALSREPGHISLYALTVEERTPLARRLKAAAGTDSKEQPLPSPDEADALWLAGREALIRGGYEHYEVSNFARPGRRCLHNARYWRMENWIGIGPGASGTIINTGGTGLRTGYGSLQSVKALSAGNWTLTREELDRAAVLRETLLMGFRWTGGPDAELFRDRFGRTVEQTIPRTLQKWPDREKRMLFLNPFLLDAFEELDNTGI